MQINDAKNIPLFQIVQHLGGKYSHTDRNQEVWYFSPFRPNEKTASFKINEKSNRWFDFGHVAGSSSAVNGSGGDIYDLWCDYYGKDRRRGFKEALEDLNAFSGNLASNSENQTYKRPIPKVQPEGDDLVGAARFKILHVHETIFYNSLIAELQKRRISRELAGNYLKQVYIQDLLQPDKKMNGFAFPNDQGGFEISIPNPSKGKTFKTSTRPKAMTTFRAKDSSKLFVFEGMWDFLSWLEMQDTHELEHNCVVLNSLSFCGELASKIIAVREEIETVILFLDNDDAGKKATHFMCDQLDGHNFTIRTMGTLYFNHKDMSDYWSKDPSAKKVLEQIEAAKKYFTDDSAWHMVMGQNKNQPRNT